MFEKLLSLVERAVVALEKLAAAPTSNAKTDTAEAPAKPAGKTKAKQVTTPPPADDDFLGEGKPEPEPEPEPEPVYERADVKKALQDYGTKHGMPKAQELFKEVSGVTSLSELPVEKFATVIEATKKPPKK